MNPNGHPQNNFRSYAYGTNPIDLTRSRQTIIQLIWNAHGECVNCESRQEPHRKANRSRMVYRHDGDQDFLYCIPCAAVIFGLAQDDLVSSLNLESAFHDQECARRIDLRAQRLQANAA